MKRKQGKTKIDREINEYLRRKKSNNTHFSNNNNNNNASNNNNNNLNNIQMINNSLLAMNYLLLQNQLLMQQRNPNIINQINNTLPQNCDDPNNIYTDGIQKNNVEKESDDNHEKENLEEKGQGNREINQENNENIDPSQNTEIIKKILEALNGQNIINNNEERLCDPRKKGK